MIALTALSQTEFAHRLGVSPGFVSDVIRGVKRPGVEFLVGVNRAFGISIDWLLLGNGTMLGGAGIQVEFFSAIRLQVAIARAAVLLEDPVARALLLLLREGKISEAERDPVLRDCLGKLEPAEADVALVIQLYNGHLWSMDPVTQRRNILEAAITHFEAQRPIDRMAAITGNAALPSSLVQMNTGKRQRISGGDYIEVRRGRK